MIIEHLISDCKENKRDNVMHNSLPHKSNDL